VGLRSGPGPAASLVSSQRSAGPCFHISLQIHDRDANYWDPGVFSSGFNTGIESCTPGTGNPDFVHNLVEIAQFLSILLLPNFQNFPFFHNHYVFLTA
jgi:hypothetical protein